MVLPTYVCQDINANLCLTDKNLESEVGPDNVLLKKKKNISVLPTMPAAFVIMI